MTRYISWLGTGEDIEFATAEEAHQYMRDNGFEPTGQWTSDAITDGGQILWQGFVDFYGVRDGNGGWKPVPEGFEPRVRTLCRDVEEDADGEEY